MPWVVSVSGARGVVGDGLTPDLVVRLAAAHATLCGGGPLAIGRDSRVSGPMVLAAAACGVQACGADVLELGIVPTPTVQLAVELLACRGGLVVSASHNPPEWNALKFVGGSGSFLSADEGRRMLEIFEGGRQAWAPYDRLGALRAQPGAPEAHLQRVLSLSAVDVPAVRARRFKVVLDCAHGAGAVVTAPLLQALGCETWVLGGEPTGRFSRGAEPVPENLGELGEEVRRRQADLGLAHDPDADRLAAVDETGRPIGEEYTLALCADHVLGLRPGPVVMNLSTSELSAEVARRHGAPVFRTPVGEAHVVQGMREHGAVVGGEGNGGLILPECHLGRDGSAAAAVLLSGLARRGGRLSEWVASLPVYHLRKTRQPGRAAPERLRTAVRAAFPEGRFDERDGIRVDLEGGWVQVRASGTEPISRILAEARDPGRAEELCGRAGQAWRAAREG
ncbi:MAG TPA: phosphoglucosamine mutase [Candidatus Saccharimonadales bacterium]|nr:phosphoglucosamine mutase [Candidatus Saccharimonadales bacterium]